MKRRLLWPLLPLASLYGAAQALDSHSYAQGWRSTERLRWPVISVGNLSVGGAGKTPFVIMLARMLADRGWSVDVLSRGYGRSSDTVERVAVERPSDGAARYGDEPLLIARATGLPVFVGRSRTAAGQLAERSLANESGTRHLHIRHLHILDDGMQHRRLARDVEIVLLHRSDFETTLLPAGRLREPLAALERADIVVIRDEDTHLERRARRWMRQDARLWRIQRELSVPALPGPAVVFCAIAHPDGLLAGLRNLGVPVAAVHAWRDHHRFTSADLRRLTASARQYGAACFLTTEKDRVRLTAAAAARLEETAPLLTASLTVRLFDQESVLANLEGHLLRAAGRRNTV